MNARRKGLRVLHFSLESNHIHLILEAQNNVLRSLRETKDAIHYVLFNHQKHRNLAQQLVSLIMEALEAGNIILAIKRRGIRTEKGRPA